VAYFFPMICPGFARAIGGCFFLFYFFHPGGLGCSSLTGITREHPNGNPEGGMEENGWSLNRSDNTGTAITQQPLPSHLTTMHAIRWVLGVLSRMCRVANMLFIEAPAGVGFSYSDTPSDYNTNYTKTGL
jgi:hypothetical protein